MENLDIPNIKETHIRYALLHPQSEGDPEKALGLLRLLNDTVNGMLHKYNPLIPMVGAENRNNVTCYIDSLLFAIFARVDSFESMLSVEFADPATNNLAFLIRLWVNMLRTGRLFTIDLVKFLQDALGDCGWDEAREIQQQDVSEAFTFITDRLALPLLTLKMDVYHTGKESNDDHRLVRERLLDVAIPEEPLPDGSVVKLEDCLENFFNNKVEVKRMLQRRNTITSRPSDILAKRQTSQAGQLEDVKKTNAETSFFRKTNLMNLSNPTVKTANHKNSKDDSVISYGIKSKDDDTSNSLRKEVLIPAWQFFHLVPWFQNKGTIEGQPTTDAQVAAHFAKRRPVLGICLKRYKHSADGGPKRLDTYIDVPLEIRLPHFISDGTQDDGFGSSFSTFKLSLQSIVCHRGVSLNAGHYVSIVRPTANEISTTESISEHERRYQWLMHDDLAREARVTVVDVRKALKAECPYVLFYQVQPIEDDEDYYYASRSSSEMEEPPTYAEATLKPEDSSVPIVIAGTTLTDITNDSLKCTISPPPTPPIAPVESVSNRTLILNGHLSPPRTPLLGPQFSAGSRKSLEHSRSAPPVLLDEDIRAQSLDLTSSNKSSGPSGQERGSTDSSNDKRKSVVFTDSSVGPSVLTTPIDGLAVGQDGYLTAKDLSAPPGLNVAISPGKKFTMRRGRVRDESRDDKDKEEKAEKRSSRIWSTVGNRNPRPKSVPPNTENRTYMANMMKGLKGTLSKDKLPITVLGSDADINLQDEKTPLHSIQNSPKLDTGEFETLPRSKKEGKEKNGGLGLGRKKSTRSRSMARRLSVIGLGETKDKSQSKEEKKEPDRECTLM